MCFNFRAWESFSVSASDLSLSLDARPGQAGWGSPLGAGTLESKYAYLVHLLPTSGNMLVRTDMITADTTY